MIFRDRWNRAVRRVQVGVLTAAVLLMVPDARGEDLTVQTEAGPHVMVLVPAGEFAMGAQSVPVTLDAYYLDKYEVSNALYGAFVAAAGHRSSDLSDDLNGPEQPVVRVSWQDAMDYCGWVGLRLPTEAEWEKAAGGGDGRRYPWGDEPLGSGVPRANFGAEECGGRPTDPCWPIGDESDGYFWTAPVDSYPDGASPYGVINMFGNVSEWVFDWDGPIPTEAAINPTGPATGRDKIDKGGHWFYLPPNDITSRGTLPPDRRPQFMGFRCAQSSDALPTLVPFLGWGAVKEEMRPRR